MILVGATYTGSAKAHHATKARIIACTWPTWRCTGISALSVHDSTIVPVSGLKAARRGLVAAFVGACGIMPRLDVERLDGAGRIVKEVG